LVLIYRKYYGTKLALKLLLTFWAVMSVAGLMVEGIFYGFDAIPTTRPHDVVHTSFEWNYTTFLNIAFLAVFAVLYWLYRNRERLGGGQGYALDPVCGMQVRTADAPATRQHEGHSYSFCSDHCAQRFDSDAHRYARTVR
jgi:YHS domain-containing protein